MKSMLFHLSRYCLRDFVKNLNKNSFVFLRLQDEEGENPCFPTRNDRLAFINDNIVRERCVSQHSLHFPPIFIFKFQQILMEYLNKVLKHPKFRHHPAVVCISHLKSSIHLFSNVFQRDFFGVSCISFVHGLSISLKEGYLLKRSHDDYRGHNIFFRLPFFCDACKFHHGRKYVFPHFRMIKIFIDFIVDGLLLKILISHICDQILMKFVFRC